MKETIKDLIYISFGVCGVTHFHLWPITFPYHSSYAYIYNKDITVDFMYATFGFFLVGQFVGSSVAPYMSQILGIANMYLLLSIIEFLMMFFTIYYTDIFSICIVQFFKGFNFQGVNTASNLFLSEKYKEGIKKVKLLVTTRLVFSFLLMYIAQKVINPSDQPQSLKSKNDEYFFQENIALNFKKFCIWYGCISSISLFLPFLLIENPQKFPNNILKFINYLRGIEEFDFNTENISLSASSINNASDISIISQNQQFQDKQPQLQDDLIRDNEKQKIEQKPKSKIYDADNLVKLLCFIVLINLSSIYYNIDMYKYISLLIGFKDSYITVTFFVGTAFYISGNFIVSYVWEKSGFHKTLTFFITVNCANLFLICCFRNYYIFQIVFSRFGYGYLMLFQDLFCYTHFGPFKAMNYIKQFLMYGLIGNILQIIFNFMFFSAQNYLLIYYVLLGFNLISVVIHIKYIAYRNLYTKN